MGLFSRWRKPPNHGAANERRRRDAANLREELAEANVTERHGILGARQIGSDGVLDPQANLGSLDGAAPSPHVARALRATADPEDDNATEELINDERDSDERPR